MSSLRRLLSIILLLLLSGCGYYTSVSLMLDKSGQYPPTTLVEVLNSAPARPYIRLAELETEAPPKAPTAKMLESLVEKAKRLGADAVVLTGDEVRPEEPMYCSCGGLIMLPARRVIESLAIRYR